MKMVEEKIKGFPEQAGYLGKNVIISTKSNPGKELEARVLRDDKQGNLIIFQLSDGKCLLNSEVKSYRIKENELQSLAGKCIVRLKQGGDYYDGDAGYMSDFLKAKIYNENEIPDYIKRNQSEEIIHLDSEEGLKLLIKEVKNLSQYVSIEKPRVRDAEKCLDKLYHFDLIQEWVKKYNEWNHPLIGISHETENIIIEEIVNEKE
jgi:hypothetical protein